MERKRFRKEQLFSKRTFLAQVLSLERKCVYGYNRLLSKEEIEAFGVNALDKLDVKADCVIITVTYDDFKNKSFLSTGSFFRKKVY